MEFIEKNNGIDRVYSVNYNDEKLRELLNEIVRNASYKENGIFVAPYNAEVDYKNNKFISGANLPNGDPMFENIERIYSYVYGSPFIYNDDSITVKGTKVTSPALASIIAGILEGDASSVHNFMYYEGHEELIPIDEKIALTNDSINGISNFEFGMKIDALNKLKDLCKQKHLRQYFNTVLLKEYYLKACELIKFEEVESTNDKTLIRK